MHAAAVVPSAAAARSLPAVQHRRTREFLCSFPPLPSTATVPPNRRSRLDRSVVLVPPAAISFPLGMGFFVRFPHPIRPPAAAPICAHPQVIHLLLPLGMGSIAHFCASPPVQRLRRLWA